MQVFNYGGGRQTVALAILIKRGVLPRPDRIVCADTSREARSTWEYLDTHVRPLLATVDLDVEIAPHSLATVDLHSHQGTLLLPIWTATGKFSAFCSSEWKRDVIRRYLRSQGIGPDITVTNWIGFAFDERRRIKGEDNHLWQRRFPLVELGLTKADCQAIVASEGLPPPPSSSCWMCPNRTNAEWRHVRDNLPDQWEQAVELDEALREDDDRHAVYLHRSRLPLWRVNLDTPDLNEPSRACSSGMCMV